MQEAQAQGRVRALGLCTNNPEVMHHTAADDRFAVLMASLDDREYSESSAHPQIEAAIRAVHNKGRAVVLTDLLSGYAGRYDPLGILEWAVNIPYAQSLRFTPSCHEGTPRTGATPRHRQSRAA